MPRRPLRSGLIGFARGAADDEDRRALVRCRGLSLRGGLHENHGARRCLDRLPVDLERGRALRDDVELLLTGLAKQGLVVLSDHVDAARRAVRLDAERGDVEAAADVESLPPVVRCAGRERRRLELVEPRKDVALLDCGRHVSSLR
jgi:hypothetical protein